MPRILIADDQPDVLEALRLLLKGEGYQTETVNSPDAALRALETRDFDAALIDLNYARDTKNERQAPKVQLDEPDPETGSMQDAADATPNIEADLLRQERMNAIKQHVMALPERQRMAVLMHKYQEMDYKAIGSVLKLSESATKSLLFRAYQTLRDRLKDFV